MEYEIINKGHNPILRINLEKGETVKAEVDAMITMSESLDLKGTVDGGLFRALKRQLANEKMFMQEFTAKNNPGTVRLAPATEGDIDCLSLDGSYSILIQKGGFLAATGGVNVSAKMQNLSAGLFSGNGFWVVEASGIGELFVNAKGSLTVIELAERETILIDNGHIVAWPSYMKPKITKAAKGLLSSITSGEKLVCKFTGPGAIVVQSRKVIEKNGELQ